MILRRFLFLLAVLVGVVPPSSCFQPTHAHVPSLHTINRQFEDRRRIRELASSSSSSSTALKVSTAIPPPPLQSDKPSSSSQQHQQSQSHHNNNNHGIHLFRPKKAELTWLDEAAYQRRKDEWASKYTSVDALRETFGANRNKVWGDLDAPTARRLYKTLLPKALLELYKMGVHPEDLAPLAYRARVAAKLYARERCSLPCRVAANLYDGFRQWRRYGSFDTHGMSFQQIWEKYSAVILEESSVSPQDLTSEDVTAQICLKILERSCATNEMVDNLVLRDKEGKEDLEHFTQTLEQDVRRLLQPVQEVIKPSEQELQRIRTLRRVARIKRRLNMSPHHRNAHKNDHHHTTEGRCDNHSVSRTKFPWQQISNHHHRSPSLGPEPQ